jgi:hypothetical protein
MEGVFSQGHGLVPDLIDETRCGPAPLREDIVLSKARSLGILGLLLVPGTGNVAAQAAPVRLGGGIQAIGLGTLVDPAISGSSRREAYLTQTFLLGRAVWAGGRLAGSAAINLEGLTMPGGELVPGNAGEGYVDRRHPHTYLHELALSLRVPVRTVEVSLTAGRGFAPFGTDDPMVRPFVTYPANHHLSQILERWIVVGAVRAGPFIVEGGLFNGDEPTGPGSLGLLGRFADSWSARATVRPVAGLEAQASWASVRSPEFREGRGLDQRKASASVRYSGQVHGLPVYSLLEWAETNEYAGGRRLYVFNTLLAETSLRNGDWMTALRLERTTRPEEERLLDPFRSARPHTDENIIGATRWSTVTVRAGRAFRVRRVNLEPFAEVARSRITEVTGAVFDPVTFYGSDSPWTMSVGLRVNIGMRHERMGRYGVARDESAMPGHTGH